MQSPVAGQAEAGGRRFAFGVDPGVRGQPTLAFEQLAGRLQQVPVERRVEKDQVEGRRRLAVQIAQGVALQQLAVAAVEGVQVLAQAGDGVGVHVQRQGHAGATRQRLQIERAAAGERVEHPRARKVGRQPVEQGFADPVRRRPQAFGIGEAEAARAPFAADDAQLALAAMGAGANGWIGHQCSGTPLGCSIGFSLGGGSGCCSTLGPAVTMTKASSCRCLFIAFLTCSTVSAWISPMKSSR